MQLSLAQLVNLAQRHGFPNPPLAAAVAMAESGGNPRALADTRAKTVFPPGFGPEYSAGLWQINTQPNANPQFASWDLTDPDTNAKAAFQISSGGRVWTPWSTFTSGAYKRYYAAAAAAATAAERVLKPLARSALPWVPPALATAAAVAMVATAAGYAVRARRRSA